MPYINTSDLNKLQDALMSRDEVACLKAIAICTASKDNCADRALIERAREEYQTDDIEIDDDGVGTSQGENGTWVAAWVWLPDEDEDETQEEPLP